MNSTATPNPSPCCQPNAGRHGATDDDRRRAAPDSGRLTLQALTLKDTDELDALYRSASVPASLTVLNGTPPGRMLTVRGTTPTGVVATALRHFAASRVFPWAGKTFRAERDDEGGGMNRLRLLGEHYPFKTSFGPSAIDGQPCIILDYDNRQNPFFIRAVHDELREVAPGLFLGPAMIKTSTGPALALYFAVDKTGN